MAFNLGEKESRFQAHRCIKGPKVLLHIPDEKLVRHRILLSPYFVPLPYLFAEEICVFPKD